MVVDRGPDDAADSAETREWPTLPVAKPPAATFEPAHQRAASAAGHLLRGDDTGPVGLHGTLRGVVDRPGIGPLGGIGHRPECTGGACYGTPRMTTTLESPVALYGGGRPNALRLVAAGLTDIWSRRRLTRYLVQADLTKKGSDTILGNIWWILDPLLQMAVYVVFVSLIVGRTTPDYPLFVFAAILPWKWFSSAISDAILSVVARERIIKQVHFPKIVLPVAAAISGIVNFAFGLIPLVMLILLFYRDRLSWTLILIPLVAVVQFVFTLGLAVLVSAINVFYRDVGNVARHVLRLWFYLSPALYSVEQVHKLSASHPEVGLVFGLNPFTVLFEAYRAVIYDGTPPSWFALGVLLFVSVLLLGACTYVFKRMEPAFAKVL